jgi:Arc/MetJ family transcription regulator
MLSGMARITIDVNEDWLEAARQELGTRTKVATINEALRIQATREQARRIIAAFDSVPMDFAGSGDAFGYGGGRDLASLEQDARDGRAA